MSRFNGKAGLRRFAQDSQRIRRSFSIMLPLQTTKSSKKTPVKTHRATLEYKSRPPPLRPVSSSYTQSPKRTNPLRYRTIPIVVCGITIFSITAYCTALYINLTRDPTTPVPVEARSQRDVSSVYSSIARKFDASIDSTEWFMGYLKLRRKLASQAHGHVLEVSIGTGRNLEYYDWDFKGYKGFGTPARERALKSGKVKSFTAVDKSGEMLEVAHEKFSTLFPGILGVRWVIGDASEALPLPKHSDERSGNIESEKYDTIIQTFGLCSVDDPVKLLENLGKCVKEEDGRILLLEHGRGRWNWLNKLLDQSAEGHASKFGCWWNRDMEQIVKDSGLDIVKIENRHGGTTWWIELKKARKTAPDLPGDRNTIEAIAQKQEPSKKTGWW